jgi:hypothetical protein
MLSGIEQCPCYAEIGMLDERGFPPIGFDKTTARPKPHSFAFSNKITVINGDPA